MHELSLTDLLAEPIHAAQIGIDKISIKGRLRLIEREDKKTLLLHISREDRLLTLLTSLSHYIVFLSHTALRCTSRAGTQLLCRGQLVDRGGTTGCTTGRQYIFALSVVFIHEEERYASDFRHVRGTRQRFYRESECSHVRLITKDLVRHRSGLWSLNRRPMGLRCIGGGLDRLVIMAIATDITYLHSDELQRYLVHNICGSESARSVFIGGKYLSSDEERVIIPMLDKQQHPLLSAHAINVYHQGERERTEYLTQHSPHDDNLMTRPVSTTRDKYTAYEHIARPLLLSQRENTISKPLFRQASLSSKILPRDTYTLTSDDLYALLRSSFSRDAYMSDFVLDSYLELSIVYTLCFALIYTIILSHYIATRESYTYLIRAHASGHADNTYVAMIPTHIIHVYHKLASAESKKGDVGGRVESGRKLVVVCKVVGSGGWEEWGCEQGRGGVRRGYSRRKVSRSCYIFGGAVIEVYGTLQGVDLRVERLGDKVSGDRSRQRDEAGFDMQLCERRLMKKSSRSTKSEDAGQSEGSVIDRVISVRARAKNHELSARDVWLDIEMARSDDTGGPHTRLADREGLWESPSSKGDCDIRGTISTYRGSMSTSSERWAHSSLLPHGERMCRIAERFRYPLSLHIISHWAIPRRPTRRLSARRPHIAVDEQGERGHISSLSLVSEEDYMRLRQYVLVCLYSELLGKSFSSLHKSAECVSVSRIDEWRHTSVAQVTFGLGTLHAMGSKQVRLL
ncbi:hypothetical protein Tco_0085823 [Tanacetum coccineum]